MGRRVLQVAVCGAGPAGLSAAMLLRRLGHHVSLFDQFVEPRAVGSGLILQPTGLAVLDALGLGQRMRQLGQRIDRLAGRLCGTGRLVLDIRYDSLGEDRGYAVHRAALFNVLSEGLAAEGGAIIPESRITGLDGRSLLIGQRREGPFDLIVDALGARSPLIPFAAAPDYRRALPYGAVWASLPWPEAPFDPHALVQRYAGARVMIGVLPIGRTREGEPPQAAFFWSLKPRDHAAWAAAGLDPWKAEVRRLWPETEPLLAAITSPSQLTLAAYDHRALALPFGPGIAFIGDSAHATSPQLGQGANMALLDAAALAEAVAGHAEVPDMLAAYARKRRFHVRLYQALSRIFTPFYQSDSTLLPALRDLMIPVMSRPRVLQRLLATVVAGRLGLP
jgi:2-polyprenyl-6-methoxyphenol hydroxylase-like FAD-dependent oxidoreductase